MQCLRRFEVSPDSRFLVSLSHTGFIKTLLTSPKVEKAFCFVSPLVVAVSESFPRFKFSNVQYTLQRFPLSKKFA